MTFWLNGEFSKGQNAINVADRGFLLGDGVFETILVVNGVPAFWSAHLTRLQAAMTALRINCQIDESFIGVILELVARNQLSQGRAALRLTVSRGPGPRGLLFPSEERAKPAIIAAISKIQAPKEAPPIRLAVSSFIRSECSVSSRHKTLNYLDNVLACDEAAAQKCDDAVMLNSVDRVACVSMGNIFKLTGDGDAVTPAQGEGALKGIVRGVLLDGAAETGLSIEQGAIERSSLLGGGLFVTNSLLGVRPAVMLGEGDASPAAADKTLRRLQSWYEGVLDDDLNRRASEI